MPLAGIGPATPPARRIGPNASGDSTEDGSGEPAMTPSPPQYFRPDSDRTPANQKQAVPNAPKAPAKTFAEEAKKYFCLGNQVCTNPIPRILPTGFGPDACPEKQVMSQLSMGSTKEVWNSVKNYRSQTRKFFEKI